MEELTDEQFEDDLPSTGLLSFYDRLRERVVVAVERRGGRLGSGAAEVLLLAPDVFMLLARLSLDREVPKTARALVASTLAYFILPVDMLPEAAALSFAECGHDPTCRIDRRVMVRLGQSDPKRRPVFVAGEHEHTGRRSHDEVRLVPVRLRACLPERRDRSVRRRRSPSPDTTPFR